MPRNPKRDRDDRVPKVNVPSGEVPSGAQVYKDIDHDSSVTHYEIRPNGINVTFGNRDGGSRTLYYAEPGHVRKMIPLAVAGEDLNRYVNLNKPAYSVESVTAPPEVEQPKKKSGRRRPLDQSEKRERKSRKPRGKGR